MNKKKYEQPSMAVCFNVLGEEIAFIGDPTITTSDQLTKERDDDFDDSDTIDEDSPSENVTPSLW